MTPTHDAIVLFNRLPLSQAKVAMACQMYGHNSEACLYWQMKLAFWEFWMRLDFAFMLNVAGGVIIGGIVLGVLFLMLAASSR